MIISEAWLREWVPTRLDTQALAHKLTMAGLEIGTIEGAGEVPAKVVVGKISSCEPHPRADRLQVCEVDVGRTRPLKIVCGAPNARTGLKTAVALIGATLPGGMKIEKTRIRDVVSSGMLCSAKELGLSEDSSGIIELDSRAKRGQDFGEHFGMDDKLMELDLTPNRGDCLSMEGVARELSALTGAKLRMPELTTVKPGNKNVIKAKLVAQKDCPRFVCRVIEGVDPTASTPAWMVERLRRAGVRSISVAVDITNYVMLELGQPMHAFDRDKLTGGIHVRRGNKGEKVKLLDGSTVSVDEEVLVIADDSGAIALAGIMGGDSTAISDATTSIVLEAAFFNPAVIAGRARRYGMHTDASHRFERGVNPLEQVRAMHRATELLTTIAGGVPGPVVEAVSNRHVPGKKDITLRADRLVRMLGREYKREQVDKILTGLGMKVKSGRSSWRVVPPAWRFDVTGEHDLVEEVARVSGYSEVPVRAPRVTASNRVQPESVMAEGQILRLLVDRGYREAITYSFVDPELQSKFFPGTKPITLANPIASNMAVMRLSLLPGLVQALVGNYNRQHRRIRLFESGRIYEGSLKRRRETARIGGVLTGTANLQQWSGEEREVDFFDMKGDIEALFSLSGQAAKIKFVAAPHEFFHPGQSADIVLGRNVIGHAGQLHPSLINELDVEQRVFGFEVNLDAVQSVLVPKYASVSRFPATRRDLAVVVKESVAVGDVLNAAEKAAGSLLSRLELFDVYRGEGVDSDSKSVAFGLTLQDTSRTLKEAEVDSIVDKVLAAVEAQTGGKLRG